MGWSEAGQVSTVVVVVVVVGHVKNIHDGAQTTETPRLRFLCGLALLNHSNHHSGAVNCPSISSPSAGLPTFTGLMEGTQKW
jgi:hypothetical protein